MSDTEPTADEVHEAIETLIAEGKAERITVDGVAHIRLTPAGMLAAALLATLLDAP